MIDWASFLVVAASSLVGACLVVTLYATGLRLLAPEGGRAGGARRALAYGCFALCVLAVLGGIYLIVPAFSG